MTLAARLTGSRADESAHLCDTGTERINESEPGQPTEAANTSMAKSDPISILLARVGPTPWDDTQRLAGATDLPLTERAERTLEEVCLGLGGPLLSVVFCAPDEASVTTAKQLVEQRGGKVKKIEDLAEVCLGLWEGQLISELEEKYPRASHQWLDDPGGVIPPEGEPLAEARERIVCEAVRVIDKARPDTGEGVALVLKPMAMGVLRCVLDDAPSSRVFELARETPDVEWITMMRPALRELRDRVRAKAHRA